MAITKEHRSVTQLAWGYVFRALLACTVSISCAHPAQRSNILFACKRDLPAKIPVDVLRDSNANWTVD